jgi:membrane protein
MKVRLQDPSSLGRFVVALWRRAVEDRVNGLAAEMAFFATFSVFPGLLVVTGLMGWLGDIAGPAVAAQSRSALVEVLGRLFTVRGLEAGGASHGLLDQHSRGVVTSALVLGLLAMSRGFATAIRALDRAYGLREKRSWLDVRITAFLLALGSAAMVALVLALFVVGPFFGHGRQVAERFGLGPSFSFAWDWLRYPVAFLLLIIWLSAFYRFGPSHEARWAQGLPGAVGAGLVWVLIGMGFGAYIRILVRFNPIFGVLGGGLILLSFIYLQSFALILGGEVNALMLVDPHGDHGDAQPVASDGG